jgi:hypothetical protein
MRGTQEIVEAMDAFERYCKSPNSGYIGCKIERIEKNGAQAEGWPKNHFYTNSELNEKFQFFLTGYSFARARYMH